jgi:hypothetical protein
VNSGARLKAFVSGTAKGSGKPTATAARSRFSGPAATELTTTSKTRSNATSKTPASKQKAGGRYKGKTERKFTGNTNGKGWRSEDRRYECKDDVPFAAIFSHSQEWLCHERRARVYFPPDCFAAALLLALSLPLLMLPAEGVRPVSAACSCGVSVNR